MDKQEENGSTPQPEQSRRTLALASLFVIMLLALGLRVYNLDAQSANALEVTDLQALESPGVGGFLEALDGEDGARGSLYHIAQYCWTRVAGTSMPRVRLFSVILGLTAILLAYALGSLIYGRQVGLLAALCLALSPAQIHHCQSVHPIALMLPLALVSLYGLLRASQGGSAGWWALNFAANVLLLATHVFGALLIVAQLCFILICHRRPLGRVVAWTIGQATLVAAALVLALTGLALEPTGERGPLSAYAMAPAGQIVTAFFADDALALSEPGDFGIAVAAEHSQSAFWSLLPYLGVALLVLFVLCIALFLVRLLSAGQRSRHPALHQEPAQEMQSEILLLLVAFLPVAALLVLSLLWRPCMFEGSALYSSVALYLIVVATLVRIPIAAARSVAVTCLVALLAIEAALFVPSVRRADWLTFADTLKEDFAEGDVVLIQDQMLPVLAYHVADDAVAMQPVYTLQGLCEGSEAFLTGSPDNTVWLVKAGSLEDPVVAEELEPCLASRGLTLAQRMIDTQPEALMLEVTRDPSWQAPEGYTPKDVSGSVNYERMLANLGIDGLDPEQRKAVLVFLRTRVAQDVPPEQAVEACIILASELLGKGDFPLVEIFARSAVKSDPQADVAYGMLAVALAKQGNIEGAERTYKQGCTVSLGPLPAFEKLFNFAYINKDLDAARTEVKLLQSAGHDVPGFFLMEIGLDPAPSSD